ncbi:MAG: type 1 glutamine amidotransferase family protein [Endomicrobiaceae bacterium]
MDRKIVYVYLLDGLSDWELGYVLPELQSGQCFKKGISPYTIKTVSLNKNTVMTMGGLHIIPDMTFDEIDDEQAALLLLPGSYGWLKSDHSLILAKTKEFLDKNIPVGAVCAATIALAKAGFLNNAAHTSNDLDFLKKVCPEYTGEKKYRREPAVSGGNLITAGGTAPIEFAREILKKLGVISDEVLDTWYKLYKEQDSQYYFKLMQMLSV